jgi:hypothetical protein
MRYFELLGIQDVVLYLFPTVIFVLVFALALACAHWRGPDDARRHRQILYRFPDGIEDRNAPFPLAMGLIIAGTVLWAFGYILMTGLLGVII